MNFTNVIKYLNIEDNKLNIVLELADSGDLSQMIKVSAEVRERASEREIVCVCLFGEMPFVLVGCVSVRERGMRKGEPKALTRLTDKTSPWPP